LTENAAVIFKPGDLAVEKTIEPGTVFWRK